MRLTKPEQSQGHHQQLRYPYPGAWLRKFEPAWLRIQLSVVRPALTGNKRTPRGVVWECSREAYAWWQLAARVSRCHNLGPLAGGITRSMSNAQHTSRRLERRWAPRYSFRANLEIEWGSAVLRASTRDISSNGMFIESNDPLWVGAGFTALLTLDRPVKVDCFVKRIEPGLGMGVAVTLREEQHEKRYQDLLASLSSTGL